MILQTYSWHLRNESGYCSMCNKECRRKDTAHHHCVRCLEIMCTRCHQNMDYYADKRRHTLQARVKRIDSGANAPPTLNSNIRRHWAFEDDHWTSIAQLRTAINFSRRENVDFKAVKLQYGLGTEDEGMIILMRIWLTETCWKIHKSKESIWHND